MADHTQNIQRQIRLALSATGLLNVVRQFRKGTRYAYQLLSAKEHRTRTKNKEHLRQFTKRYGHVLGQEVGPPSGATRKAMIIGRPLRSTDGHLVLAKVLQMAGYELSVLLRSEDRFMRHYYELAGVQEIQLWSPWEETARYAQEAQAMVSQCRSLSALLDLEYKGVRVGRTAVSTTLRRSQLGSIKLGEGSLDGGIAHWLASAMAAATAASRAVEKIAPDLAVSTDMEYTPKREVFDACLARRIDVVVCSPAHRRNALMLRRYTHENRNQHPSSLSDRSWDLIRQMPWTEVRRRELQQEMQQCYSRGDWWGIPAEHVNKEALTANEIRSRLKLDPGKKTAFVFPHVPWDASFCWGDDLFEDYQEWLLATVRAACSNSRVNWVVKIHPANVAKSAKRSEGADPIEATAIQQQFGKLPPHVILLPANSDIGTISLFEAMDFCLTVRGTVGIEAASLGIPVLTGGTGRYDRRGFTIDSSSTEQYLERLRNLQEIPRITNQQRELAERFAYGLLLLRPLRLDSATPQVANNRTATGNASNGKVLNSARSWLEVASNKGWQGAEDLRAFATWLRDSEAEDFLMPLPG